MAVKQYRNHFALHVDYKAVTWTKPKIEGLLLGNCFRHRNRPQCVLCIICGINQQSLVGVNVNSICCVDITQSLNCAVLLDGCDRHYGRAIF